MQRVKARAPASFKAQVNDTERRLNILFEHLNNGDLLKPNTVETMVELSHAIQARNYDVAHALHLDILTNQTDECGNWMVSSRLGHLHCAAVFVAFLYTSRKAMDANVNL